MTIPRNLSKLAEGADSLGVLGVTNGGTGSTSTTFANLTSNVTGTLPIANGGTGLTSPGASGNVLTSNGTGFVSSAPAGSPWVFLSTITASTSATVDIENAFDSTYPMYAIVATNVRGATSGANIQLRVKIGGSYITTTVYTSYGNDTSGLNYNGYGGSSGANGYLSAAIAWNSEITCSFILYIPQPYLTTTRKNLYSIGMVNDGRSASYNTSINNTGALQGVRIFMSGATNIATGTFALYGIKNS